MSVFRLNLARLRGTVPIAKIVDAIRAYGAPPSRPYGVLAVSGESGSVSASVFYRAKQTTLQLIPEEGVVVPVVVEKAVPYRFRLFQRPKRIEVYDGSFNGLSRIEEFLSLSLGGGPKVDPIEIELGDFLVRMSSVVERFQLRRLKVKGYAPASYVKGTYDAVFDDSDRGLRFLADHGDGVTAATVSYSGENGRVTIGLTARACFSYSCSDEDESTVRDLLREIA